MCRSGDRVVLSQNERWHRNGIQRAGTGAVQLRDRCLVMTNQGEKQDLTINGKAVGEALCRIDGEADRQGTKAQLLSSWQRTCLSLNASLNERQSDRQQVWSEPVLTWGMAAVISP